MSVENVGGGTTPTTPAPTPPPSTPPPASGSGKQVVAHFMVIISMICYIIVKFLFVCRWEIRMDTPSNFFKMT